ncbi:MAG: tRNA lysidine(34) synthetase TilS [Desulfobacteraceae bacterium]|nr:tRNA lysidine(34) synthetase TilS [Desulfobacteraceae bacterium]
MSLGSPKNQITDPLVAQTMETIERHAMLARGDCVLVGVSGGPDSVALLHLLHTLAPRYALRLGVAHLDHGLRPEAAAQELALVRGLAEQLQVPCHNGKLQRSPHKGSLEEHLRDRRYAFFEQLRVEHGYTKIALGHQAEDNAEGVLLHLLRGSGIRGLAGIPPVRDGYIIRPLIEARREQILAYLQRHDLRYAHDPSNEDPRFERNQIRHLLLPLLVEQYNPNVVAVLNRLATLCREEEQWFADYLAPMLEGINSSTDANLLELHLQELIHLPGPLQRRLLRAALAQWQGHLRRLGAAQVEALRDLALGRAGRRLNLPGGVRGERTANLLRFTRQTSPRSKADHGFGQPYEYTIESAQQLPIVLAIPEAGCRLEFDTLGTIDPRQWHGDDRSAILIDLDQVHFPLKIRNRRPGDRFQPFGPQGSKKIKTFMIDEKIPVPERDQIPLLLSGDTIMWIVGIRRGQMAPLSSQTRQVLRVCVDSLMG